MDHNQRRTAAASSGEGGSLCLPAHPTIHSLYMLYIAAGQCSPLLHILAAIDFTLLPDTVQMITLKVKYNKQECLSWLHYVTR